MIGLTSKKIAVDPIFDKRTTESHNALTREDKAKLAEYGIEPAMKTIEFVIPDSAIERCDQGIIRYVGHDVEEEFDLHVGDYILFSGHTGTTVRLEGEGLLILMSAEFATCIIHPPETEIPGLYFLDNEGEYWPATSEMAIDMIRRRFEEIGALEVKKVKPDKIARAGA